MKTLLQMYDYAEKRGIDVYFFSMESAESVSLPEDENNNAAIAIDPWKVKSLADEKVKLAHELGHCMTGAFYCENARADFWQKCETVAMRWAILNTIPEEELKKAVEKGYTELWELSEYFDIPEAFMADAIYYYKNGHMPCRQTKE